MKRVPLKMKWKFIAAALAGVIVTLLGLLWILQGAGILKLCPVLCIAQCECVTGGSQFWETIGAIAVIIGVVIIGISVWAGRRD